MTTAGELERGRHAFARRDWGDAYAALSAADREAPLDPEDLDLLAAVAYLTGRDADAEGHWTRAHHGFLDRHDPARGARCAFWIAFALLHRGEEAQAGGWLARSQRVLDEQDLDCVERGYLLFPMGVRSVMAGDFAGAYDIFVQAGEIGVHFGDVDLVTWARHGQGRALIRLGRTDDGVALLDEAMIAITSGEVSPILAGDIYCSTIEACQEVFDLARAHEWTSALTRWCDAQQDLVPYRGQCLIHRTQIMMLHGAWHEALEEAHRARDRLSDPPGQPAVGAALYELAEIHRLRGEVSEAEDGYRRAHQHGRMPQPGLALLRLVQGKVDNGAAAIRTALEEAPDPTARAKLLPAHIEIMLAAGDVGAARASADELATIAGDVEAPLVRALAARAQGAVLLAEGDARAALDALRTARSAWQELDAPYETARARVLIGLACRALGDPDTAELELDAARATFEHLGATPDLGRIRDLTAAGSPRAPGGLTPREVQILRLVAAGKTNRAIAEELVISEKTVARHLSNTFTKLGLSTRAAATAYAYEHELV